MIVKTLPSSSQPIQEDSRGGTNSPDELYVTEVVPENGTPGLVVSSPRLLATQKITATAESEILHYDPVEIGAHYKKRPLQIVRRIFAVLGPTLSFVFGLWSDGKRGVVVKNDRRRAIQLRELLTQLGPAYIKIGQALSTRPDLVPPVYLEELTRLQDQLPPFPNEIAYQFIEEELGAPPEEVYAELSPQPIAAASLGQVYKGKLKTGEEVAIKVQRPDLRERITIDLYILRRLAAWVQKKVKRVRSDLVGILG